MDFVVLARKLRPARFEHLIGQDTVVRALRNAILSDRVAHAFLFAGSRGVGKTSTARILTKALNCEQPGADGEPCNECGNCREITLNTSPDVYEIDAASNRGIDNIRELRENTKYAPVKSRYKTYIIDEVHMLTMESFNALLKTLEEPPPHVKFILATTNPHRIPETILSRCQRYDFARIPVPVLADYLATVTEREGLRLSRAALETIARNAAGGVRDALTAIDQVVSFAGSEASDDQVLSILGLTDNREVFTLLGAVLDKDVPAALAAFAEIRERGHDLGVLLEALIREVKDFSLYLSLGGQGPTFADHPPDTLAFYEARQGDVTLDELQQLFYLLLEVEEQIKRSDFAQACFEMGLVKACRVAPLMGVSELLTEVRALAGGEPAPESPRRAPAPARPSAIPPSAAARIAALNPSRARESGGAPARRGATAGGDRGAGDDADEAEPVRAQSAPAPAAAAAPAPTPPDLPEPPPEPDAPHPATAGEAFAPPVPEPVTAPDQAAPMAPRPPEREPPAAAGPDAAGDDGPPVPADEGPALCDDPRWRGFVEALGRRHRRLASKLRRAEVTALTDAAAEVLAADAANRIEPPELEAAAPFLAEAFGDAFSIRIVDDTTRKAREAHTIAGRNRIAEAARIAARRAAAQGDERVQRLLRHFPNGRVVEIALSEAAPPNGSEDV